VIKKYCEWQSKYCAFGDEPFSVSELTAFVLGGRPGAFFFLLVIATGLLLFSTSKKQPPKIKKKYAGPCVHAPKNGGKNTPVSMPTYAGE
jgi:hypothetical protein